MASESSAASRFYVLRQSAGGSHDTEFEATDRKLGDAPQCPRCNAALGMLTWLPPYRGELKLHGADFGDFVRGRGNELLLSERMAEAFQREGLRGLSGFQSVEIVRVRKQGRHGKRSVPPKYFCVSPAFLSAAVDEARSRIQRARPTSCDWCRSAGLHAVHGFAIDEGSWNGDDVFRPRGAPGKLVVSEHFERFVARHGFTNMQLTPTEEFIHDYDAPWPRSFTPEGSA